MNMMTEYCNSRKSSLLRDFDGLRNCILQDVILSAVEDEMSEYEEAIKHLQDAWDELTKQVLIPIKEYNELRAELARRDEIITRLKEDGERLAKVNLYDIEIYNQCPFCFTGLEYENTVHQVDCPITLHRALMKELE